MGEIPHNPGNSLRQLLPDVINARRTGNAETVREEIINCQTVGDIIDTLEAYVSMTTQKGKDGRHVRSYTFGFIPQSTDRESTDREGALQILDPIMDLALRKAATLAIIGTGHSSTYKETPSVQRNLIENLEGYLRSLTVQVEIGAFIRKVIEGSGTPLPTLLTEMYQFDINNLPVVRELSLTEISNALEVLRGNEPALHILMLLLGQKAIMDEYNRPPRRFYL